VSVHGLRRGRGRGFTLIEVLVALLIVAFGMGAVLSALSSAADSTMRLREKTFAEWVGFNQLSTARLNRTLPANGSQEGEVDFAGTRWHWLQTVTDMDVPGLKRITIQVRHADAAASAASATSTASAAGAASAASAAGAAGSAAGGDWLAAVMGFRGDAIATPLDVLAGWDGAAGAGSAAGAPAPAPAPSGH
jgi:general secretion pathway protein I